PQKHPAHGALHRVGTASVQRLMALIDRRSTSISELCAAKCRDVRTWRGGCRRASALAGPAAPPRCGQRDAEREVARTALHRAPTWPCRAAPSLRAGLPTGKAWCAASSAPWPARLRRARLPQRCLIERGLKPLIGFDQLRVLIRRGNRRL